ncbi:methyltransferase [Actinomadura alba]|uniref:Methyltransferase n=1 Tax=Actinomadura alba TaxID=406431 RepID=A0ABR7LUK2_9ACTN|nr:methyltransferase [Actinomadura alba]MBC6468363.1 methyltransferase [Actinomadura alba]
MTTPTHAPPFPPAKIYRLSTAFWHSKVILSASDLGVFAQLGEGPATAGELADKLGVQSSAFPVFLDALVAMDLLERDGDRYRNSAEADYYLVPDKRYYMGTYLGFVDRFMRPTWEGLSEVLRTGKPQIPHPPQQDAPEGEGAEFFEQTYADPNLQRMFIEAQDALSSEIAWELSRQIDWSRWTKIVDLGGARGNVAGILLQAHPHLTGTVFDMPPLEPLFAEHMARLGVQDRARYQGGDWFDDPLPEGEALLCGHALHNWTAEQRRTVISKAFDAVRPGGAFMVYDLMMDEERSRLNPLLLSLAMTLSVGGSGYLGSECREWMREAGFVDIVAVPLKDYDGHTVVIGRKPM